MYNAKQNVQFLSATCSYAFQLPLEYRGDRNS